MNWIKKLLGIGKKEQTKKSTMLSSITVIGEEPDPYRDAVIAKALATGKPVIATVNDKGVLVFSDGETIGDDSN